jgi:DNA repair photolyase
MAPSRASSIVATACPVRTGAPLVSFMAWRWIATCRAWYATTTTDEPPGSRSVSHSGVADCACSATTEAAFHSSAPYANMRSMRWDNLSVDADEPSHRLPGYKEPAAIRTFDAPEALDTRFYEVRAKSALNKVPKASRMPFRWTINPYRGCTHACQFCFSRPTHTYLGFDAGRDFEREIVVKVNAPEVVRAELRRPRWAREHVAIGTNTDPYQWVESKYRLMPGIWEALRDSYTPCSVLTKSPLLLRDMDLFKEIHQRVGFVANLSVPTLDEKAWRATEPHTPHPRKRLEAVAELNRAGIPTGILIAPLMPGINDAPEQVEEIVRIAEEAGATNISGIHLHLRGEVRGIFMDWLRANRPDLVPLYERLYARGAYAPKEERARIRALVRPRRRTSTRPMRGIDPAPEPSAPAPRPEPRQASLF